MALVSVNAGGRLTACLVMAVATAAAVAPIGPGARAQMAEAQQVEALSPFSQAVAAAAGSDAALAAFYLARSYRPIWTGSGDAQRRNAFFQALATAGDQGLPVRRYDPNVLAAAFRAVRTERDRGRLEVMMSAAFLQYAHDIQTGVLTPSHVDPDIKRAVPLRDRLGTLDAFTKSTPAAFLRQLPPQSPDYARLLKAKLDMERLIGRGGWGPQVAARKLEPGDSGPAVVQLRNRLIVMGYLRRTATPDYDANLQSAVQQFQADHGLNPDGVAGTGTIEEVNVEPVARLQSIIVAMERLRWMNMPLGRRHVWVNLADFSAKVIDNGKVTFETRAIVGKNGKDTRSPEFSDQIEFMVVNPTWNVPRSIVTKEYLPMLQRNPNAVSYLKLIDARGRTVSRADIDFTQYTANTFPYALKQPPSDGNALGLVKFMFPNKYNIYLHDTPTKSLFKREVRAFSHGCIRLNDPFDFAYTLLSRQTSDPKAVFRAALRTGHEDIRQPRRAGAGAPGLLHGLADGAGRHDLPPRHLRPGCRDICRAARKAGVALRAVQG